MIIAYRAHTFVLAELMLVFFAEGDAGLVFAVVVHGAAVPCGAAVGVGAGAVITRCWWQPQGKYGWRGH